MTGGRVVGFVVAAARGRASPATGVVEEHKDPAGGRVPAGSSIGCSQMLAYQILASRRNAAPAGHTGNPVGMRAPTVRGDGPSHAIPADPQVEKAAWCQSAGDLADWALAHVVLRRDCYGSYRCIRAADGLQVKAYTNHGALTRGRLIRHFSGEAPEDRVGVHVVSPGDELCKVTVVDIDAHGPEDCPEANWVFVRVVAHPCAVARRRGSRSGLERRWWLPRLVPSHSGCLLRRISSVREVARARLGTARPAQGAGVAAQEPGVKRQALRAVHPTPGAAPQASPLDGRLGRDDGRSGRWFLARRRRRRSHTPDRGAAGAPSSSPLVPAEFILPSGRPTSVIHDRRIDPDELDRDAALARDALSCLGKEYYDVYDQWVQVGMALRQLGDVGLGLWHEWSSQSGRYHAMELDEKWKTFDSATESRLAHFGNRPNLIGLGSLFAWATEEGWERPHQRGHVTQRSRHRRWKYVVDL